MISKKTGEPPVIIDSTKTKKSILDSIIIILIMDFFNVDAAYKVDTVQEQKRIEISTGKPYFLDTVQTTIATPC
jgi:hypothetical protein